MFLENSDIKYLLDILYKENIESIFASSWDSIYIFSEDGYLKLDFSFENKDAYNKLVEGGIKEYNIGHIDESFINIYSNIYINIHKWCNDNFWITLIKK